MPINRAQLAKTSGYKRNCALQVWLPAALARVVLGKVSVDVNNSFLNAFNTHWHTNLSFPELRQVIINCPNAYRREVLFCDVFRSMLLRPEVIAGFNFDPLTLERMRDIINSGGDLESNEIVPLANFFGVAIEEYSDETFKRDAKRMGEVNNRAPEDIQRCINELRDPNPDFSALARAIVPQNQMANDNVVRAAIETLRRNYTDSTRTNLIEQGSPDIFAVQNRNIHRINHDAKSVAEQAQIVKLWNRGNSHWEYEERDDALRQAHNRYYDFGINDYQYDNDRDAANIQNLVRNALNPANGGRKNLNLTPLLTAYERDAIAIRQNGGLNPQYPARPAARPYAGNANANNYYNNNVNNFMAGFADLFNGKAFANLLNPNNNGMGNALQQASNNINPTEKKLTWMGLIENLIKIVMGISTGLTEMVPPLKAQQEAAEWRKDTTQPLPKKLLGDSAEARVFAEFIGSLPARANVAKASLQEAWADNTKPKAEILQDLQAALHEENFDDAAEYLAFKAKTLALAHKPVKKIHLESEWHKHVFAKRQDQSPAALNQRNQKKAELNDELQNVLQQQNRLSEALLAAQAGMQAAALDPLAALGQPRNANPQQPLLAGFAAAAAAAGNNNNGNGNANPLGQAGIVAPVVVNPANRVNP